jgi:hypothetical protein
MRFLRRFVINLLSVAVFGFVLYLIVPDVMGAVYQAIWILFGPLFLLIIVVPAIPNRRKLR